MTLSLKRRLMFKVLSFLNHSAEKRSDLKVCPYSLTFGYNAQGKLGVVSKMGKTPQQQYKYYFLTKYDTCN